MDHSHPAVVLVLVGLIASGKVRRCANRKARYADVHHQSTFAQALEHHFPEYRRCNQDDLGNRRLVENLARQSLRKGMSVCVDRTNFNAQWVDYPSRSHGSISIALNNTYHRQRSHWINIAREFPGTPVWVIVFDAPYEVSCTTTSSDGSMSPQACSYWLVFGRFVPLDCVHVRGHSTCHMFSTDAIFRTHRSRPSNNKKRR